MSSVACDQDSASNGPAPPSELSLQGGKPGGDECVNSPTVQPPFFPLLPSDTAPCWLFFFSGKQSTKNQQQTTVSSITHNRFPIPHHCSSFLVPCSSFFVSGKQRTKNLQSNNTFPRCPVSPFYAGTIHPHGSAKS